MIRQPHPIDALIPAPRSWWPADGYFHISELAQVREGCRPADVAPEAEGRLAELAVTYLEPVLGRRLGIGLPSRRPVVELEPTPTLRLQHDPGRGAEQFRLDIAPGGLVLSAAGRPGVARGLAVLFQLCALDPAIPCGVVEDGPAFPWRGLLLDSGRHFQPVATVRGVIDRLALYRFNVLHWHLTEDQGWRLEVPGLPELTAVGAWRAGQDGGERHGGFYTARDVRAVVAYATERGITVVPEIEMPGHCQAALAAYPELSCTGGPFEVQKQWGIFPDIFCAGNDAVFAFLEQVLAHVLELFPSTFIHVGGDEAPKGRWRACPRCRARLDAEGLRDEHELQGWFIRRVGNWLAARGRRLVGWDEILEGGLAGSLPGAVVQSWRGVDGAVAAARAGHDTVVSPTSHAYLDYDPGVLDLARVLAFDPVPPGLRPSQRRHVLGGAANLWTEYVPADRLDRQLFPRLPAMAEALWAAPESRGIGAFYTRLRRHEAIFAKLDIRPGVTCRPLAVAGRWDAGGDRHVLRWNATGDMAAALTLSAADIRAAVLPSWILSAAGDGARPEHLELDDLDWQAVAGPDIEVEDPGERVSVVFRLVFDGAPVGAPEVMELVRHRALGRPVALQPTFDPGDAARLTDGILGTWRHDDGRWFRCGGADLDATMDLGGAAPLRELRVRFLQDANARIFPPNIVHFHVSTDGLAWRQVGEASHGVPDTVQDKVIVPFATSLRTTARHVRIHAVSRRVCPDWHPEAGHACWLYADQIVVRDR